MKCRSLKILATVLAVLPLGLDVVSAKEARIALVFGNSAYSSAPRLANSVNDARLIATALRSLGFEVLEHLDADQKAMKRAIIDFGERLEKAGKEAVGLFYYAGHGVQVKGVNYLIPIGTNIKREADVDVEAVSASWVLGQMEYARNRINVIVLDACRNNPFARSFRSAARGLARMDAPRGSLLAYSTGPGNVAVDGSGANSPYTSALAMVMTQPGLKLEDVFKQVRISVMGETNDQQVPWESSSLTGDFYFNPAPSVTAGSGETAAPSPEMVFWQSILRSDEPADFEAYLDKYPEGAFAPLARNRLAALTPESALPEWPWAAAATYEGEVTNPVRPYPDKIVTRLEVRGGALAGSYTIFEPDAQTSGKLEGFRDTGKGKGVFRWQDAHGEGTLNVEFSDDLRSFTGRWQPDGLPDQGGAWSGRR